MHWQEPRHGKRNKHNPCINNDAGVHGIADSVFSLVMRIYKPILLSEGEHHFFYAFQHILTILILNTL